MVVELGQVRREGELHGADRAIALLADVELRQALVRAVRVVDLVAVDEQDHVRVLLDGAGFPQVGHVRALVRAALQTAIELRTGHDRATHFLCNRLQRAGYFGNLVGTVLLLRRWPHELQVVHHDHLQRAGVARDAPRPRPQVVRRERRGVVDVERLVLHLRPGAAEAVPVVRAQLAGAHLRLVDAAEGRQQAHDELICRLLHRKDEHRAVAVAFLHHRVFGHVHHQRRLAHGRARRDDHEVGGLEAGGPPVQVVEAGCDAGDGVAALQRVELVRDDVGEYPDALRRTVLDLALADVEDGLLGLVEHVGTAAPLRREGGVRDLVGGADEPSQRGAVAHDFGIGADVRRARRARHELSQVAVAAGILQERLVGQRFGQRERVQLLVGVGQLAHGVEDDAVAGPVEVLGGHFVRDLEPRLFVQHQAAKQRLLGVDGVRRNLELGGRRGGWRRLGHRLESSLADACKASAHGQGKSMEQAVAGCVCLVYSAFDFPVDRCGRAVCIRGRSGFCVRPSTTMEASLASKIS